MGKRLELIWPNKDKVLLGLDKDGKPIWGVKYKPGATAFGAVRGGWASQPQWEPETKLYVSIVPGILGAHTQGGYSV